MKRIEGLDALRGIAALCVLLYHIAMYSEIGTATNAYLAVDFFFMLSGYVMARTYEARLSDDLTVWSFFSLRYRRLWPIMAVSMILGTPRVVHELGVTPQTVAAFSANLALIPYLLGDSAFVFNVAAWSIFFELFGNALHGAVIWRVRTRILLWCIFALIAYAMVVGLSHNDAFELAIGLPGFVACFPRLLLSYLGGVVLYRLLQDRPPIWPGTAAFAAMPVIFLISDILPIAHGLRDLTIVVVAFPLILASGLHAKGSKWLARLGAISFPLYAVHMPVITWMLLLNWPVATAIPISLILAYGAAASGRLHLVEEFQLRSSQLMTQPWRRRTAASAKLKITAPPAGAE